MAAILAGDSAPPMAAQVRWTFVQAVFCTSTAWNITV